MEDNTTQDLPPKDEPVDPKNSRNRSKKKKKGKKKRVLNAESDTIKPNFYAQFADTTNYEGKVPLIYSAAYNIGFLGLEKLHPFDSCKYKNVVNFLIQNKAITSSELIEPIAKPSEEVLRKVHTEGYLKSLRSSYTVAHITELFFVAAIPNFLVRRHVLDPMLYATSGSIVAAKVAKDRGWAINLSGGYHHCCGYQGGGFCAYADITLSLRWARENFTLPNVMIIDLDAHQGNGHERDKIAASDHDLYIMDMYNRDIYPGDSEAKMAINKQVELRSGTTDDVYLRKLQTALDEAFHEFQPDIIYYNAGTDILEGDPLGCMDITSEGVIQRDELVFRRAFERNIPIVMLLSGGYQKNNAKTIASSIINLDKQFALFHP